MEFSDIRMFYSVIAYRNNSERDYYHANLHQEIFLC